MRLLQEIQSSEAIYKKSKTYDEKLSIFDRLVNWPVYLLESKYIMLHAPENSVNKRDSCLEQRFNYQPPGIPGKVAHTVCHVIFLGN